MKIKLNSRKRQGGWALLAACLLVVAAGTIGIIYVYNHPPEPVISSVDGRRTNNAALIQWPGEAE